MLLPKLGHFLPCPGLGKNGTLNSLAGAASGLCKALALTSGHLPWRNAPVFSPPPPTLYLGHFHLDVFFQEEFSCSIKTGLLHDEIPYPTITCRLTSLSVFQIVSLASVVIYTLLVPVILYNLTRLCRWDKRLLSIYEMLPAFDLLSRKMLGCPINDLNVILLSSEPTSLSSSLLAG